MQVKNPKKDIFNTGEHHSQRPSKLTDSQA